MDEQLISRICLAVRKTNEKSKSVLMVERDPLGRWFRKHGNEFLNIHPEGLDGKVYSASVFHQEFELLDLEQTKLFCDDSYKPQLIYPSFDNTVEVMLRTSPPSSIGGNVTEMQLVEDGSSFYSRILLKRNDDDKTAHIIVTYKEHREALAMNCNKRASFSDHGSTDSTELSECRLDVDFEDQILSRSPVNGLFCRYYDSWKLPSDEIDTPPSREDVMNVLQSTLSTAGTLGALLATISVAGFFIVALAFASVDNTEGFTSYTQKPLFAIFLLSISGSLFSSLASIVFVIQGPLNVSLRMAQAMFARTYNDPFISYTPSKFNGQTAQVSAITHSWRNCALAGSYAAVFWSSSFLLISISLLCVAILTGGFFIAFSNKVIAAIFFFIFVVLFLILSYALVKFLQEVWDLTHLGFWTTLWATIQQCTRTILTMAKSKRPNADWKPSYEESIKKMPKSVPFTYV